MSSFITSYADLFAMPDDLDSAQISGIEIPLIQRDYAQGRQDPEVVAIRADLLDVLCDAATGSASVGLDFVYGDVRDGILRPLDGQQRLTTLFLLHWYVAFRTGHLSPDLPWTRLRYATRASAELFCERIVVNPPPADVGEPTQWITDQSWYHLQWRHDPTIKAMLVMIDALDQRLHGADLRSAWTLLTVGKDPAIWFHVLPIEEMGAGDQLYIKMNSRGKPLTPFENFKARFEKALEGSPRGTDFANRVDGPWSNVLWRYRGDDDIVDDEFLRYFRFITEVTEWQSGKIEDGRLETRAEQAFGTASPYGTEHLDFLFGAFEAWVETNVEEVFASLITIDPTDTSDKVRFFGVKEVDLFHSCCDQYAFGRQRAFGWAETLTLYAVVLHRIHKSVDFPRRLRLIRNLVEASTNELRVENMPDLIRGVGSLVLGVTVEAALADLSGFNDAQIDDERSKDAFLNAHQELREVVFSLEDHRLLRGSLVAFDLDPLRLATRAASFQAVMGDRAIWPVLTSALLVMGDYSRKPNTRSCRFGSPEDDRWWRELLTGTKRESLKSTAAVLEMVLDAVSDSDRDVIEVLQGIRTAWLNQQDAYDWRYYLIKYDAMREGRSGIYFTEGERMGFRLCMLDKSQLNSWYRDPFLLAILRESGVKEGVRDPWFTGYETDPRWLTLSESGVRIRCVDDGYLLEPPPEAHHLERFGRYCADNGIGSDHRLLIPQVSRHSARVDLEDRVIVGAHLIKGLVVAGL